MTPLDALITEVERIAATLAHQGERLASDPIRRLVAVCKRQRETIADCGLVGGRFSRGVKVKACRDDCNAIAEGKK